MRMQPDGTNLLDSVASLLREQVLPGAVASERYALRMAINAIGIARRQLANGEGQEQREHAALTELLGSGGDHDQLARLLAQQVRAGAVRDNPALRALLWQMTEQRVRESAPRYLEQEGL